jgi:hypothetical protein
MRWEDGTMNKNTWKVVVGVVACLVVLGIAHFLMNRGKSAGRNESSLGQVDPSQASKAIQPKKEPAKTPVPTPQINTANLQIDDVLDPEIKKRVNKALDRRMKIADMPAGLGKNVSSTTFKNSIATAENCEKRAAFLEEKKDLQTSLLMYRSAAMYFENAAQQIKDDNLSEYGKIMQRALDCCEKAALQEGQLAPECTAYDLAYYMSQILKADLEAEVKLTKLQKSISKDLVREWLNKSEELRKLQKAPERLAEEEKWLPEAIGKIRGSL